MVGDCYIILKGCEILPVSQGIFDVVGGLLHYIKGLCNLTR